MAKAKPARYELTREHRAQLEPWRDRWIANAMNTAPMTEVDREVMREAVVGLYWAAGLTPPPAHRIVFVPSPFVARFAGGFAAAIWWLRKQSPDATEAATWDATEAATEAATWDATEAATRAATRAATWAATLAATRDATWAATEAATWDATEAATEAATWDATEAATRDATWAATGDATLAATWDATEAATEAATWDATRAATEAATEAATWDATWDATEAAINWWTGLCDMRALVAALAPHAADLLLRCAANAYSMWDGGNQWSGYSAYLSFFRHVAGLPLDYSKWQHYEAATIHGGPRVMHAEFCLISDRPTRLLVDHQRRPHCEDGPFCAWADGTALWAWHGTRVPAWIIAHPERITAQSIVAEPNAEVRRVMLERMGHERFIRELGALPLHADRFGTLYRVELPDDEPLVMVSLINSTPEPEGSDPSVLVQAPDGSWRKRYWLRVPPDITTAHAAVAWTFGRTAAEYQPAVET